LARRLKELVHFGLIEMTRQGGLNRCSLYALTWRPIDDCKGKLDCAATKNASGKWKEWPGEPLELRQRKKSPAREPC
jgi:hypothetical protein